MAAALQFPHLMTLGEFLDWDSPGPYLWQLLDGVPVAMSPPAPRHGAIENELGRLIGNHLVERGSPCRVVTNGGVIPNFQFDKNFMIPDLAVSCSASDLAGQYLREPVLLIEILSPSNYAETWRNIWAYLTIPSVREILVVRTMSMGVELLRRGADEQWPARPDVIESGDFTLSSIDLTLPMAALYRGTATA